MADDQTEIKNPKHAESCIANMQSLWESEELCDLTLKVGDSLFKVHKLVLVSQNKYFKNMLLEKRYVEANENLVELEDVNPEYFQKILRYFYYGSIMVSMEDIEEIIKLADYFLIDELKTYCAEYIQDEIDVENCISGYVVAYKYNLKDEYWCQTLDIISRHIDEISETDDFCKLSQNQLVEILNYNASNGCSENLFHAIFQWIAYDKDNRHDSILDLVKIVSTRGLKQSFLLESLLTEPLIRENSDCSNWLFDQIHERFATKNDGSDKNVNHIFVTNSVENISYSLNINSKELTSLSARPKDIRGFCVCSYKDNIYLLGGEYEGKAYDKSLKINSGKKEWEELNWEFGRRDAGACVLSNEIYMVGGYNIEQQTVSRSFRVCDLKTGKQIRLRDMIRKRRFPALCTHGGSLFACCGNDERYCLDTIERYDPREGYWEIFATLPNFHGSCSAAIQGSKMFICKTGMDGRSNATGAEPYQLQLLELRNKRSSKFVRTMQLNPHCICTIGDKVIYVEDSSIYAMEQWQSSDCNKYKITDILHNLNNIIVPWENVSDCCDQ